MTVSRRGVAATVTAAALLVVGVDYATFAATGDSLILGRLNHAAATTRVVKAGPGPALRLTSRGTRKPSLAVSSPALVRRLNADLLDGKSASTLASKAVTYRGGSRGDVYPNTAFWPVPVTPGIYLASFKALVIPDPPQPPTTSVDVICGLADLNTIGPRSHVYTADSGTYSGQFPAVLSGAETVRVGPSANPGIVCTTTSGNFTLFSPVTASWTPVNSHKIQVVDEVSPPAGSRRALFPGLSR